MGIGEQIFNAFNSGDSQTAANMIVSLAFWVLRAFAAAGIVWGIYGIVVARKEGDGTELTNAITKLALGWILFFLPNILRAVGILA